VRREAMVVLDDGPAEGLERGVERDLAALGEVDHDSFAPRNIRHPEHLGEKTRTPCLKNFSKFLKPGVQNINKHNFGGPNGIRTRVSVTTTFSPIHSVSCKAT
jgi:hypothetical protein